MNTRKKIFFILPNLNGGGAEKVLLNIANNLNIHKFQIFFIVFKLKGKYVLPSNDSINYQILNTSNVLLISFKLIRLINSKSPDYIFSSLNHINIYLALFKFLFKIRPKIIIREPLSPKSYIISLNSIFKHIYSLISRYLYPRYINTIVSQCYEMVEEISSFYKYSKSKIKVIYNPLQLENISSDKIRFNPFDSKDYKILAVGRLSYQKGFDILFRSLKVLSEKISNFKLYILGEGNLKNNLIKLAKELNISKHIIFIGFVQNPYPYYFFSDLYVLSSRYEGFPNSLLEAMACGTKVVSTRCFSGPTEIIGINEDFGFLANTEDPKNLASKIYEALNSNNRTKNRALFFDIKKIVVEYENVFI